VSRYAMVLDLKRCVGCNACVVACKSEHNTPNNILCTMVLEKELGTFPHVSRLFIPVLCNHCDAPVCVDVCPSGASHRRPDGIVDIDWELCLGCKACVAACPYDARHAVQDNRFVIADGQTEFVNPSFKRCPNKVPVKCDFCAHRIDAGCSRPACVEVCPTAARVFGDLDDPDSPIQSLIVRHHSWCLLPEKMTKPRVFYIG
jgi:molybdopterin-containing oxidoreductase family iron-sulfur binding subunit